MFADQVFHRNPHAVKLHLPRVYPTIAELLQLSRPITGVFLNKNQAHAFVSRRRVGIGFNEHRQYIAFYRVRDPLLGAVDYVLITVTNRPGANRLQVGSTIRFCQRDATT